MKPHWRHLANMIELASFGPTRIHSPNGKPIGSAVFAQLTVESPYTLQWALGASVPQNYPFPWGSGPHLIYYSIFAGLTTVTDRPTDRQTDS